ncbi:MAG TPA: DUF748 domain-containing protein [Flavobacteriales bacterium]|nr:DUF748 domain-containing protein [Flavobacteriales bacterium]
MERISDSKPAHTRKGWRRIPRRWRVVLIIVGVLVIARLILPWVVLHFANDRLANMPGYYGHIEDIDIALIRGAYVIDDFFLDKLDSVTERRSPFLAAHAIDLSVEWKALFHGSLVGELVIEHPKIMFTLDSVEPAGVQKDTADFRELLRDFMPLSINRVEAHDGELVYRDPKAKPKVDVRMMSLEALATNLRNSYDSTALLPSTVKATALIYGGTMAFNMKLDPLSEQALFDMNAELEHMELVKVNDFFKAYAKVDVNKGTFGMYTELATRNGAFTGYVKPVLKDLDVLGPEDRHDTFFRQLWEGIVGTVGDVLTNPKKDQVATKVEFKGKLSDPQVSTWYAVIDLLRNAFIRAIQPALDNEVNINTVGSKEKKEGFLQRIFGGKDEKKKK